jgi:hypothetical protein
MPMNRRRFCGQVAALGGAAVLAPQVMPAELVA